MSEKLLSPKKKKKSESEKKVKVTQLCSTMQPYGLYSSGSSLGQNSGVGSLSLLQGIFPVQGSNPGLPHCGQILYQLSHQGSPRRLEWVAYPFSRGSYWPRNGTGVSCTAGSFFKLSYLGKPWIAERLMSLDSLRTVTYQEAWVIEENLGRTIFAYALFKKQPNKHK